MERIEQRFARHLCQKGYITQEEIDWCAYSLQKRFLTLVTTIIVLILGLLVSNWWQAFLFVCGVAFLRTYTNGYHAKTFWGCLVLSCAVTVLCLLAKTLYPARFADVDIRKETREFYRQFFGLTLSDAQMSDVLNPPR